MLVHCEKGLQTAKPVLRSRTHISYLKPKAEPLLERVTCPGNQQLKLKLKPAEPDTCAGTGVRIHPRTQAGSEPIARTVVVVIN